MPWWESSLFWGITGLVGGILISTIFYFVGKERYLMKYRIATKQIISSDITNIAGITIFFNEHPIKELVKTTIKFTNSGNQTIEPSDYAVKEPLCIHILGHLYQHSVSAENNNSIPTITPIDSDKYKIEFDFLKPKQSFTIEIFHNGNIDVLGELRSGNTTSHRFEMNFRRYCKAHYQSVLSLVINKVLLPICLLCLPICVLVLIIYVLCTVKPFLFGTIGVICGITITGLLLFSKKIENPHSTHEVLLKRDRSR